MAKYLIVAQDGIYRGERGVEVWTVEECPNEQEAFSVGHDMSLDLIDSYADIYEEFKENAEYWADQMEEEGQTFNREEYIMQAIEEQREDDIHCYVWKLSDDFKMDSSDWNDIVEKYAVEEF